MSNDTPPNPPKDAMGYNAEAKPLAPAPTTTAVNFIRQAQAESDDADRKQIAARIVFEAKTQLVADLQTRLSTLEGRHAKCEKNHESATAAQKVFAEMFSILRDGAAERAKSLVLAGEMAKNAKRAWEDVNQVDARILTPLRTAVTERQGSAGMQSLDQQLKLAEAAYKTSAPTVELAYKYALVWYTASNLVSRRIEQYRTYFEEHSRQIQEVINGLKQEMEHVAGEYSQVKDLLIQATAAQEKAKTEKEAAELLFLTKNARFNTALLSATARSLPGA